MKIHPSFRILCRFIALTVGLAGTQLAAANQCASAPLTLAERAASANHCPIANAGMDLLVMTDQTLQLDASASTDSNGDRLHYRWRLMSAPSGSGAALTSPNAVRTSFTPDLIGDYVIELAVKDARGSMSVDTLRLSTAQVAPVAHAGDDRTASIGEVVMLNGIRSFDIDGSPLSYRWQLSSQPAGSQADLNAKDQIDAGLYLDAAGDYVAELIVNDGYADSVADSVRISTSNTRPQADAGRARTLAPHSTLILDGSASNDRDGHDVTYEWSMLAAPDGVELELVDANQPSPSLFLTEEGLYVFQLSVDDGELLSTPDTVLIEVTNRRLHNVNPDDFKHLTQRGGGDDIDGDGVFDPDDNCVVVANPAQRDTDGDGIGNFCDADLNNDGVVNVTDLGLLRAVFFSADPDADFNGDGVVNIADLGILRAGFFLPPGPAGTIIWVSLVDGDFANRLNWQPQIVPSAGALALIDVAPAVTVTATSDNIVVKGIVNNEALVLSSSTFEATDALENGGTITSNFTAINNTQIIASLAASGTLSVTGSASWSNVVLGIDSTLQNGVNVTMTNGLTINATTTIDAPSSPTGFFIGADMAIDGTGTIVLDGVGNGVQTEPRIFPLNSVTLTVASGLTIRGGKGTVGQTFANVIMNGAIIADVTGETIRLSGASLSGIGSMTALNGGGIEMQGNFDNANNGFGVDGANGSVSLINGAALRNVTMNMTAGTDLQVPSGTYTFQNLVLNGNVTLLNSANANVDGLTMNGRLLIDAPSSPTGLFFINDQTLAGNLLVIIDGAGNGVISEPRLFPLNATTLTVAPTVTIRGGKGTIGQTFAHLIFQGILEADVDGEQLVIGGLTWSANNAMTATNGGSIRFFGSMTNGGATLSLDTADGGLSLTNGAQIHNATLNGTSGSNLVVPTGTYTWESDVLNIDTTLNNSALINVTSGLTLNNAMAINAPSSPTGLTFTNTQLLDGDGTITIDGTGNSVISEPRLFPLNAVTLTVGPNITVRGGNGRIGQTFAFLVFNGTLISEMAGQTIEIGGLSWSTNQLLQATNGARIEMFGSHDNSGAAFALDAADGSASVQSGGTLRNVTVNGTAGTNVELEPGTTTLDNAIINADLTNNNAATTDVTNGLTVNGTATFNAPSSPTGWTFTNTQSLLGNLTVVFNGVGNSVITEPRLFPLNAVTLTLGPNVRVEGGKGTIGQSFAFLVLNGTTIDANVAGESIQVLGSSWSSTGTLRASGGAGLILGGAFDNANAAVTFDSAGGSATLLNGGSLRNAVINGTAGSSLTINQGTTTLLNLSYTGDLELDNGATVNVTDGLTLNGTATFNAPSSPTGFTFTNDQTIDGTGTIVFNGAGNGVITEPRLFPLNSVTATFAPGITIRGGTGTVGQTFGVINLQGQVSADTGPININSVLTTGGLGTLEALNGNTLRILTSGVNNPGLMHAGPSSVILVDNAVVMSAGTVTSIDADAGGTGSISANSINYDGTLNMSAINGFAPTVGSMFGITTTVTGGSGSFATVNSFGLGGGESFGITYDVDFNATATVN